MDALLPSIEEGKYNHKTNEPPSDQAFKQNTFVFGPAI